MKIKHLLLVAFSLVSFNALSNQGDYAWPYPFQCGEGHRSLNPREAAACDRPELRKLSLQMSDLYEQLGKLTRNGNLIDQDRKAWVNNAYKCKDVQCLNNILNEKVNDLQVKIKQAEELELAKKIVEESNEVKRPIDSTNVVSNGSQPNTGTSATTTLETSSENSVAVTNIQMETISEEPTSSLASRIAKGGNIYDTYKFDFCFSNNASDRQKEICKNSRLSNRLVSTYQETEHELSNVAASIRRKELSIINKNADEFLKNPEASCPNLDDECLSKTAETLSTSMHKNTYEIKTKLEIEENESVTKVERQQQWSKITTSIMKGAVGIALFSFTAIFVIIGFWLRKKNKQKIKQYHLLVWGILIIVSIIVEINLFDRFSMRFIIDDVKVSNNGQLSSNRNHYRGNFINLTVANESNVGLSEVTVSCNVFEGWMNTPPLEKDFIYTIKGHIAPKSGNFILGGIPVPWNLYSRGDDAQVINCKTLSAMPDSKEGVEIALKRQTADADEHSRFFNNLIKDDEEKARNHNQDQAQRLSNALGSFHIDSSCQALASSRRKEISTVRQFQQAKAENNAYNLVESIIQEGKHSGCL